MVCVDVVAGKIKPQEKGQGERVEGFSGYLEERTAEGIVLKADALRGCCLVVAPV